MAPNVIDLISSSPCSSPTGDPPSRSTSKSAQADNRLKRALPPHARDSGASNTSSRASSNPQLLVDLDDISEPETSVTKRRRLSRSPAKPPATSSGHFRQSSVRPLKAPLRNSTLERANRPEIEQIEFTSSFDSIAKSCPTRTSEIAIRLSQSSDPFASSPPCLATSREERASQNVHDTFSDPFVSSPLPQAHSSKGSAFRCQAQESPDPFATSPPPQPPMTRPVETSEQGSPPLDLTKHGKHQDRTDWDPISSSAPERPPRRSPCGLSGTTSQTSGSAVMKIDSDSASGSSKDSDDEFPDIAELDVSKFKLRRQLTIRRSRSDNISSKSSRPKRTSKKSADQKNQKREAKLVAKAAEKERKQREKELAKEAKIREKHRAAALTEANKVRTDKKVSTPEMIVVMPSSLDAGLKIQVETLLDELQVQYTTWDSPVGNAFTWQRKATSRFDGAMDRWEPIPLQVTSENFALISLTADEMVELALNDGLDSSISRAKASFPQHEMIYIIEGMNAWLRRNRNIRNRQFASVVRQGADVAASQSTRRRNGANQDHVSEDIVEDALLRLQVEHEILIHHTDVQLETAQWVAHFTQHISTIPYKKKRDETTSAAGFCMESGQVRTGEDSHDTYIRMLQEISRVTAPVAHGIAAEFGSVSKLVDGLESGGPMTLEGLRKSANRDGSFSDRTVGQAVSRRIYKVFTGRDERSTDV